MGVLRAGLERPVEPVDGARTPLSTAFSPLMRQNRAVFPVIHTPTTPTRFFFSIMNTDLATGTELRATCSRADLAGCARDRLARAVDARGRAGARRDPAPRGGRSAAARRDRHGDLAARDDLGEIEGDGAVVVPGKLLTDLARLLPDESVTLVHEEGDGVLAVTSGSHSSRLNVYSAEDFPRLPPVDGELHTIAAPALLGDDRQGLARGVARRVAAGADRDPREARGRRARHGGDRLIPPRGQGDRSRSGRPRSSTRSSRRGRSRSSRASPRGSDEVRLGLHDNHVIFGAARRMADEPEDRRAVPELQAAPPGDVRGGDLDRARTAARGDPPRRRPRPAQRAAATALRRGRAERLGADAGRGRGP